MKNIGILTVVAVLVLGVGGGLLMNYLRERSQRGPHGSTSGSLSPGNPRRRKGGDFLKQAAVFSLAAPFIGMGIMFLFESHVRGHPTALLLISSASLLVIFSGMVFGVVGLIGGDRVGWKGHRGLALAGTSLGGLLILWMLMDAAGMLGGRRTGKEWEAARIDEQAVASFLDYPGWYGVAQVGQVVLVVHSLADESPMVRMMNADMGAEVSIAQVSIMNESDTESVTVTADGAELWFESGEPFRSLPLAEVLGSAKDEEFLEKFLGPHEVAPRAKFHEIMIFTPKGYSWREVTSVTLGVNGERIEVPGNWISPEEKARMVEQGR